MKIQTLIYATMPNMPNMAIWSLLKVLGAPVNSLLYVYFKIGRAKIDILTSISKRGVSRLKNAILLENSTLSHRNRLILLEVMPLYGFLGSIGAKDTFI